MARRNILAAILAFSMLVNAFSSPAIHHRFNRATGDVEISNNIDEISISNDSQTTQTSSLATVTPDPFDDDDDDFEFGGSETSSSHGGSSIFSVLKHLTALFPGSSSSSVDNAFATLRMLRVSMGDGIAYHQVIKLIRRYLAGTKKHTAVLTRRQFELDNEIEIDDISDREPHFEKQETKDERDSDSNESENEDSDENVAEEESIENGVQDASKQDSSSNVDSDEDSDYDEPPGGGDGGGGGILGLLAGLSGGEDGQSDLGSLLATFSGIIANLSGDGIDLNSLIASGIGLFVGLLSEGEENPGAVIASYFLTSLDTITGGGAKNNGAFFGTFLSKLVKGTSAGGDPDASSEEDGEKEPMADSAGFFSSFLLALLGDMSKSSSSGSSKPW